MKNKVLSFSIFDETHDWQFFFYLRGIFLNVCMAKIVYPDFQVHVIIERSIWTKYKEIFWNLLGRYDIAIDIYDDENLCKNMLWRMSYIFHPEVEYLFCRDADSLVTFREAQAVGQFIESDMIVHGLHDNPAHSLPLLGGMCGFKCQPLKEKYGSYKKMIQLSPVKIDKRGTDQDFLNRVVYSDFQDKALLQYDLPREKTNPLYLSDLCIAFIGAAGCNEFETLRYLRSKGTDLEFGGVGKKFPNIFYWV